MRLMKVVFAILRIKYIPIRNKSLRNRLNKIVFIVHSSFRNISRLRRSKATRREEICEISAKFTFGSAKELHVRGLFQDDNIRHDLTIKRQSVKSQIRLSSNALKYFKSSAANFSFLCPLPFHFLRV